MMKSCDSLTVAAAATAAMLFAGCFSPVYDHPTCGPSGECPSGLYCSATRFCETPPVPTPGEDVFKPSNRVDPTLTEAVHGVVTISSDATFDVDTGMIADGWSRTPGVGVDNSVGYVQVPAPANGVGLGVFVFCNLVLESGATIRFTGTRAAVLLIAESGTIAGALDLAAGHGARATPGPGAGAGGTATAAAQGCGAGGSGNRSNGVDGGGAGGSAGADGGAGGNGVSTEGYLLAGGVPGPPCLPAGLEPLQGGSGGGRGSPGATGNVASGGGGGGALQITAFDRLEVTGTINAGGAGGASGEPDADAPASGAGGGAGGAILLEATAVMVETTAIIAANGGGGGAAGGTMYVSPGGVNAHASSAPAPGGSSAMAGCAAGGEGGALDVRALDGQPGMPGGAGAGGGGAVGAIVVRGGARVFAGILTPRAVEIDLQ